MSSTTSPKAQLEALLDIITKSAKAAIAEYEKSPAGVPSPLATEPHPLDLEEAPNVALIKAVRVLEGACDQLCTTLAPPPRTLVNVCNMISCHPLIFIGNSRVDDKRVCSRELRCSTGPRSRSLSKRGFPICSRVIPRVFPQKNYRSKLVLRPKSSPGSCVSSRPNHYTLNVGPFHAFITLHTVF
jgi:hypothetical protein